MCDKAKKKAFESRYGGSGGVEYRDGERSSQPRNDLERDGENRVRGSKEVSEERGIREASRHIYHVNEGVKVTLCFKSNDPVCYVYAIRVSIPPSPSPPLRSSNIPHTYTHAQTHIKL